MTDISKARGDAEKLEVKLEASISPYPIPCKKFVSYIRAYLIKRAEELASSNNVYGLLKTDQKTPNLTVINYGPTIDVGPTEQHFILDSGARLSFGITLRDTSGGCEILAYRFHLHMADGAPIEFLRFDLNQKKHYDPLIEPRCHLHPGLEEIRIPLIMLTPLEVLDRIFFVVEPKIA